jgi:1-phosphofructokinase/tagatose 6-phosphate kinase
MEAAALLEVDAPGADLGELADRIRVVTGGLVVITDGRAGSLGTSGDGMLSVSAPDRLGRFPVGSGDSFLGGLMASLDRGDAFADALRIAAAAGAANALVPGPGVLDPRQVAEIAAETTIRSPDQPSH